MLFAAVLTLLCSAVQDSDKDRLKKFGEPYQEKKKDEPEPPKEKDRVGVDVSFDDDDSGLCEALFLAVFSYPFRDTGMRYDDFPYAQRGENYFTRPAGSTKPVAVSARFQAGRVEHDLMSYGASGELRLPTGSSLSVDVTRWHKSIPGRDDRLTLQEYAFNVGFSGSRRAWNATLGLGAAVLQGDGFGEVNVLLQADGEWFVSDPFRIHARVGYMPFRAASITDLRLELGIHVHRVAFLVGVRSVINSRGTDLTGPTLGVEIWF